MVNNSNNNSSYNDAEGSINTRFLQYHVSEMSVTLLNHGHASLDQLFILNSIH